VYSTIISISVTAHDTQIYIHASFTSCAGENEEITTVCFEIQRVAQNNCKVRMIKNICNVYFYNHSCLLQRTQKVT